ncbi:MAG: hypothetical protein RR797_00950 [Christensenella sp.]
MICAKCHQDYDVSMRSCPYCGNVAQPPAAQQQYQPQQQVQRSQQGPAGLSVASMVCGIIGLIMCWVPFVGLIINALAIIFYILARKEKSKGVATAGLVCGIIGMVAALAVTIVTGAVVSFISSGTIGA